MEYLALLSQNGSLLSALQNSPLPSASTPTLQSIPPPPPPTQGRAFSRPKRGTGGELAEKQKVSKEIKASAIKRKSLVDPHIGIQAMPTPEVTEGNNPRQAKRAKVTKVCELF